MKFTIAQDMNKAIAVIHEAGTWLKESGKNPSKWWRPENLNKEFLLQYTAPDEFYVVLADGEPAAAAILQAGQEAQDWDIVDKGQKVPALYIHWLCVARAFAGKGLPKVMVEFAGRYAKDRGLKALRADTNADEMKLRKIYEDLGFKLVAIEREDYRQTAFYQKEL